MKKVLIISILTILAVGFVYFVFDFFQTEIVKAGLGDNVSGYAWSENIGWISFNCTNQGTCAAVDYGVNIEGNGKFTGFAWSENIGWIDFAPAGPYPASPNYSARVNLATGEVSGWARALAHGNGWHGWIKMRGPGYGVSIDTTTRKFSGWAWSDMVIGWISFRGLNYGVTTTFPFNRPPARPLPVNGGVTWNHCAVKGLSIPTFRWTYSDPDGDLQSASQLRIYGETTLDTGVLSCPPTCTSYIPPLEWIRNNLNWGRTYYWQVKVKDNQSNWSEWSDLIPFTMSTHPYPWVSFNWVPPSPSLNEVVQFSDQSTVSPGRGILSWHWTFQHGTPSSSTAQNPTITFTRIEPGGNRITLRVCDDTPPAWGGPYCCTREKRIEVTFPLPEYKEVPPIIWLRNFLVWVDNIFAKF